jgi:phage recombination protein Bet
MTNGTTVQPLQEWILDAYPRTNSANLKKILHQCGTTGLDPRSGDVHLIQRGSTLTIQVGIDGLRKIAAKTNELDGVKEEWCAVDGVWRDVWLATEPPAAARVTVYRKGCTYPFMATARWEEYAQTSGMWSKMPSLMISKVAEARALRRGFPGELGGLVGTEEMEQADGDAPVRTLDPHTDSPPSVSTDSAYTEWTRTLLAIAQEHGREAVLTAIDKEKKSQDQGRVALVDRLRNTRDDWKKLTDAAKEPTV